MRVHGHVYCRPYYGVMNDIAGVMVESGLSEPPKALVESCQAVKYMQGQWGALSASSGS